MIELFHRSMNQCLNSFIVTGHDKKKQGPVKGNISVSLHCVGQEETKHFFTLHPRYFVNATMKMVGILSTVMVSFVKQTATRVDPHLKTGVGYEPRRSCPNYITILCYNRTPAICHLQCQCFSNRWRTPVLRCTTLYVTCLLCLNSPLVK